MARDAPKVEAARCTAMPSDVYPTRIPTILVVDDNEANRALAKNTLEDEGYAVVVATGGSDAVAVFATSPADCVLLDVRMPDMDGFTVCERIRALPQGADTPVIFLTALRDVDTFDRALRAGGDDFVTKPVRPTELVIRVQSALKIRQMRAELREHYELLKQQRDALLRVQLQKERLMAFVVHDLKNPVNSMDLHAQLLLREKGTSESVREAAGQIRTEARQLTRMIMNLLDLSKGDEGRLSPRMATVDLRRLASEVVLELQVSAKGRKVTLECDIDAVSMRADEDLLRRTLTNLIENAIRHAPPTTSIKITGTASETGTELRVADAGAGVPEDMRRRIFDPFVQIDRGLDASATRAGRGLGLAFCKVAVEAHRGTIWVEDAEPGAAFCMRLPHER